MLDVEDVELRAVGPHDVVVEVLAAAINPGEAAIRQGAMEAVYPTTLPCGEGTDLAGTVVRVGDRVTAWHPGDQVCGWSWERSSHAEQVVVPDDQLVARPDSVPLEQAASLGVAGVTAWAAVHAVPVAAGDTVLVSAATGGVGTIAVQLLALAGAHVVGVASWRHHDWLADHGVEWVEYGDDLVSRLRSRVPRIDAVVDLFGPQYIDAALELGVDPSRIETIISFEAAGRAGAQTQGSEVSTSQEVFGELLGLISAGRLEIPVAARFPLRQVRDAYEELEQRHTLGKIVLLPNGAGE